MESGKQSKNQKKRNKKRQAKATTTVKDVEQAETLDQSKEELKIEESPDITQLQEDPINVEEVKQEEVPDIEPVEESKEVMGRAEGAGESTEIIEETKATDPDVATPTEDEADNE